MRTAQDISEIVAAAHTLSRLAARSTHNDAPRTQWTVLTVLQAEGPMRLGALATAARTTQPGMTRLVGQMVDAGLVTRGHDPADSRAAVLSVTAAGVAALAGWRVELREALAPMFADLDDDDWATLARAAHILSSHIDPSGAAR